MKNIFILIALLISTTTISAQVQTTSLNGLTYLRRSKIKSSLELSKIALKQMPEVDNAKLLEEDKDLEGLDVPFNIGYLIDVNYTLADGTWEINENERIWSMRVSSKSAHTLNFTFSQLNLSPDAELYILNSDGSMVYGPVTAEQNISEGVFITDLLSGEEAIIQLIEPAKFKQQSAFTISKVVHGYIELETTNVLATRSSSYRVDVTCYPEWSSYSRAVALVLLQSGGSQAICSGALMNNTAKDKKPYFLTAFHCVDANLNGVLSDTICFGLSNTKAGSMMLLQGICLQENQCEEQFVVYSRLLTGFARFIKPDTRFALKGITGNIFPKLNLKILTEFFKFKNRQACQT